MVAVTRPGSVVLPSGRAFDPQRSRWHGPLDAEELTYCREHDIALAYDCVQIGWVTEACADAVMEPVAAQPAVATAWEAVADLVAEVHRHARDEGRRLAVADRFGPAAEAARVRVRQSVAPALEAFAAEHGLRTADGCHLAIEVALHQELPALRLAVAEPSVFTFRAWRPADAPTYRRLLDDPQLWEYLPEPFPSPLTEETARILIEVGSIDARQEALAVEYEGRAIGQCLLRLAEPFAGVRAAEVAYWLGREHQGKGWMTRILGQFLQRAFRNHRIDVVVAWIREDHQASIRVAERCGFARDPFVQERELAASLKKPRFRRYAAYRWV